jgi:hypothetical protein
MKVKIYFPAKKRAAKGGTPLFAARIFYCFKSAFIYFSAPI